MSVYGISIIKLFHFASASGGSYQYYYDYIMLSLSVLSLASVLQFDHPTISAVCRLTTNQMTDNLLISVE